MKRIFILFSVIVTLVPAQDFGYEYFMLTEYRSLGGAYNLQKFSALSSNPLTDSNRTAFSTALPFIEFRQNGGRLAVGYQEFKDVNGKTRESFSVYGDSQNDFPLGGSRKSKATWFIPIVVGANYVRAQSPNNSVVSFDIGSLGIGSGIKYKYFSRSFGIQAFATGSLYYASEGFSTDYGSQTSLSGEVQFIFSEVLYQGILFGYRFETQEWNMSNNALDYQRQYHGAFVGFLF